MNRMTHQLVAGTAVGLYLADREKLARVTTIKPILGGATAAFFTNLPDILEPASSPNHRSIFHSLTFAAFLGTCLYQMNQWQPQTDSEKSLKSLGMLAISAYLIHLALDFTTTKSLPLVG